MFVLVIVYYVTLLNSTTKHNDCNEFSVKLLNLKTKFAGKQIKKIFFLNMQKVGFP